MVIDSNGKELVDNVFTDAFLRVASGNVQYYMVWDEKEYDLVNILNRANI